MQYLEMIIPLENLKLIYLICFILNIFVADAFTSDKRRYLGDVFCFFG